jgi:hypothetical protein
MSRSAGRDCDSPANQPSAAARARRHSLSSWTNTSSGRHATRAAAPLLLHRATDDRVRHRVGPGLSTLATAGTAGIARAGARRRSSSDYAELPGVQPAIPFSSLLADALRHAGKNEIQQPSALRAMARRGLEPGTPRFSVVRSRYLNPIYFQGISSLLATSAASAFSRTLRPFAGRYGRRLGPSAFSLAGDLLLRSVIAVAIALVPTSCLAVPPTSASAARTPGASRGRRRAPAAWEGSCLRLDGPWPFAALLGWHLASCGPVVMHDANTARDSCSWARSSLSWPGASSRYAIWQMYDRSRGATFASWSSVEGR